MKDLFEILPTAILYLACGYIFLCGFYLLLDDRFDFLSETSFYIMLVLGFLINTIVLAIPYDFGLRNIYVRDCVLVVFSFVCGVVSAFIRNYCAPKLEKYLTKNFRRKTISESFWYNILDDPRKPVWLRLTNLEKKYNLDGVLLELSEDKENPYVLLGYSQKYDLEGNPMVDDNVNSMDGHIKKVVRVDSFDEITIFYDEKSEKTVELKIKS